MGGRVGGFRQGAILLTGPSSCGKGEIARALRGFLTLSASNHISMGDVLRESIREADADEGARKLLADRSGISDTVSVIDPRHNDSHLIDKVRRYATSDPSLDENDLTQFEWLRYCVRAGLLVPDDWAESLVEARLREAQELHETIFILDGYPRTTKAAESLLDLFSDLDIGVIKVLHLSITKAEMKSRARVRGRADDTDEALDRRYDFYVEHVQPCIDYLKTRLGTPSVALIDAHQPVYTAASELDLSLSIRAVIASVLEALDLPQDLLDLDNDQRN